jgi:hypothetical protein
LYWLQMPKGTKNLKLNKVLLVSVLTMDTVHENLKEEPEVEKEMNMENLLSPNGSCSEEDQSEWYASYGSSNF